MYVTLDLINILKFKLIVPDPRTENCINDKIIRKKDLPNINEDPFAEKYKPDFDVLKDFQKLPT